MFKATSIAVIISSALFFSAYKDDLSTAPNLSGSDQTTVIQKTSNMTKSNGQVSVVSAKQIALNAVNGNITEWKLEFDLSDNMWQY